MPELPEEKVVIVSRECADIDNVVNAANAYVQVISQLCPHGIERTRCIELVNASTMLVMSTILKHSVTQ